LVRTAVLIMSGFWEGGGGASRVIVSDSMSSSVVLLLACMPLDARFTGSNPATVMKFLFRGEVKLSAPCRKVVRHVK
jgi:hypothetical protein